MVQLHFYGTKGLLH